MKAKLREILGIIGFIICVCGFVYTYLNPNVFSETYKVISDGEYVYVVTLDTPTHDSNFMISTVTINHVDYWNRNGFVIMAIGFSTILLGLIVDPESLL